MPTSLKIVAWMFILLGLYAVFNITSGIVNGRPGFDFGIAGLLIGPGLLYRKPAARMWAIVSTWLGLIGIPILLAFFWSVRDHLYTHLGSRSYSNVPFIVPLIPLALIWILVLWQYHVLTRVDVRAHFARRGPNEAERGSVVRDLDTLGSAPAANPVPTVGRANVKG